MKKMMPTERAVAEHFAALIRQCLTESEVERIRELNEAERDMSVCHTHDFCDANMVMDHALESLGVSVWNGTDGDMYDDAVDLWNAAWSLARRERMV